MGYEIDDFDLSQIRRRWDGSYVVTLKKTYLPYHVPENDDYYAVLHSKIKNYATKHPEIIIEEHPPIIPEATPGELAVSVRAERDARLNMTNWLIERHAEQERSGLSPTLSETSYTALLAYRQALRDIPQQDGFPWTGPDDPDCPWPVSPVGM